MSRLTRLLCAALCGFLPSIQPALAHMPVPRGSEAENVQGRLFTADADTGEVVVVDLPDGKTLMRLQTPPFIMGMALSSNQQHLFAMRGRTTDRDWVTVIDTGFEPGSELVRPPHIARTFLGTNVNLGNERKLFSVGGKDAIFMEGVGEILVFDGNDFSGLGDVPTHRIKVAGPSHLHYEEVGGNLYLGHLSLGIIQVLDRASGKEIARIPDCVSVHGRFYDETTGHIFYPCQKDLIVLGTRGAEANKVVTRLKYPADQRIGSFLHGKDRVRWGFTMGTLPVLYRIDTAREPNVIEAVPVNQSVQQGVSEDGSLLFSLSRDGDLEIRDGGDGKLLRSLKIAKSLGHDPHEMLDRAVLPEISAQNNLLYVSLPHEGRIAVVDTERAEVLRYLDVGGQPTRMVFVWKKGGR